MMCHVVDLAAVFLARPTYEVVPCLNPGCGFSRTRHISILCLVFHLVVFFFLERRRYNICCAMCLVWLQNPLVGRFWMGSPVQINAYFKIYGSPHGGTSAFLPRALRMQALVYSKTMWGDFL